MGRSDSTLIGSHPWQVYLLIVPLGFLILFFYYPLAHIFQYSFLSDGNLDLSGFRKLFTTTYYLKTLWFTTWQALLSTTLTMILAVPGAFVFVRYHFPYKSTLLSLSILPFILPPVVVAASMTALIGKKGWVNQILMTVFDLNSPPLDLEHTLIIILIAHVFYNYAVALRIIISYWANQKIHIDEAARVLGANSWRLWWHIRLPMLRPALLSAAILVFIFTFTSFGVILILGGPRYATLEVEIYRQATGLFNLPLAATLSLIQMCIMVTMMIIYTRLQNHQPTFMLANATQVMHRPQYRYEKWLIRVQILIMIGLLLAPLLALVMSSLIYNGQVSLNAYTSLVERSRQSVLLISPAQAIKNSLFFALTTTVLSVSLGVLASYFLNKHDIRVNRILEPVFMLPLGTSAVTLGFGFIIALDSPPLNLRTSPILIPIAHTLVATPFVIRSILPSLSRIPKRILESAQVLGANPWSKWLTIELPLIRRGIMVGAAFSFAISMGEFGATLLVARPEFTTMSIVIYRLLGHPGAIHYAQAMAMSVLLVGICGVVFMIMEITRDIGIEEF